MSSGSQWWDESWNTVTGCTKVSEGCAHCYAEAMHNRFYQSRKFSTVELHPERLDKVEHMKPKVIFVDSASDLFHEKVPFEFIERVFEKMWVNPWHTFVILTKRAERMAEFVKHTPNEIPENVWMGVTAENQQRADERIPLLLKVPVRHRFVSVEPMLGPVDMFGTGTARRAPTSDGIDLVICGGETGPGARPMRPEWVRSLRDQCAAASVPFFFKQWGEWVPDMDEFVMVRSRGTGIGRQLDGREWNELPWRKQKGVIAEVTEQLSLEMK